MSFLSLWLPPAIWCSLIFYLSSIPGLNSGWGIWDLILRKCAHMFEYAVLSLMMCRAIHRTWKSLAPAGVTVFSFLFALLYAISDEVHQMFVPRRGPSVHDVVIDTIGICIGLFVVRRWFRARSERVVASARVLLVLCAVLPFIGCGPDAQFKRARGAEAAGRSYEAWLKYQEFVARYPDSPKAGEAVFRSGWLAENTLGDCDAAKTFYSRVQKDYPASDPWSRLAAFQANNCPDYFPLVPGGSSVEGDSESGGKNARIETICETSTDTAGIPFAAGVLVRDYFGGDNKFKTTRTSYRKSGPTVWEDGEAGDSRLVLQGPFEVGGEWDAALAGRKFHYKVVSTSETVTVRAGTFAGCLVVRSNASGVQGSAKEYFAPSVGRVLSSFVGEEGERRNVELLSYKPGSREKAFQ